MSDRLNKACEAQAISLRDFGYPDVTTEMVQERHAAWKSNKLGRDVISLFCERAFEDHPVFFGTKDTQP